MGALPANGGENPLRGVHAADVLRGGLHANEDHSLAPVLPLLSICCEEDNLAGGGAGRGVNPRHESLRLLLGIELRVEDLVELLGRHEHQGLLFRDEPLVVQINGNLDGRLRAALAVAGLEHVQLAPLDRELHVLHVFVVLLESIADLHELLVALRINPLEL